jgi:hypothetical protein
MSAEQRNDTEGVSLGAPVAAGAGPMPGTITADESGSPSLDRTDLPDLATAAWVSKQVEEEVARLMTMGQKVLRLPIANTAVIVEEARFTPEKTGKKGNKAKSRTETPAGASERIISNRVEINTSFDCDNIADLLVGDSKEAPTKPGFAYCNIVLLPTSRTAPPLLFGYVYDGTRYPDNDLSRWCFINNTGKCTLMNVQGMKVI